MVGEVRGSLGLREGVVVGYECVRVPIFLVFVSI